MHGSAGRGRGGVQVGGDDPAQAWESGDLASSPSSASRPWRPWTSPYSLLNQFPHLQKVMGEAGGPFCGLPSKSPSPWAGECGERPVLM